MHRLVLLALHLCRWYLLLGGRLQVPASWLWGFPCPLWIWIFLLRLLNERGSFRVLPPPRKVLWGSFRVDRKMVSVLKSGIERLIMMRGLLIVICRLNVFNKSPTRCFSFWGLVICVRLLKMKQFIVGSQILL